MLKHPKATFLKALHAWQFDLISINANLIARVPRSQNNYNCVTAYPRISTKIWSYL